MIVKEELRKVEKVKSEVIDLMNKLENVVTLAASDRRQQFLLQVRN